MITKQELKPCPFCGGNDPKINGKFRKWINCDICCMETTTFETQAELIEYWNTRSTEPSASENFYNTFKSDPAKIVEWAESEIKAYNELIKLLKP